jgi:eukaryotic-like serine/threonine-protein kinase
VDGNSDIWTVDFARGGFTSRVTTDEADDEQPIWSPDGNQIVFSSSRSGWWDLYRISPGGGPESLLFESPESKMPRSWSSDGRYILYTVQRSKGDDVEALPVSGGGKPFPVANRDFHEDDAVFSPDARFVAYDANESGQFEIYVQSFPEAKRRVQVSTRGVFILNGAPMARSCSFWIPDIRSDFRCWRWRHHSRHSGRFVSNGCAQHGYTTVRSDS